MEPARKVRTRNTKETLYDLLETALWIEDARRIEFQRVRQVGNEKRNPREPRAVIARFLRNPDCEAVFSRRSSLEDESGFGIGPDLPKQVVEMIKKLMPKMFEARKQGKRSAFSRSDPYKMDFSTHEIFCLDVCYSLFIIDAFFLILYISFTAFITN